jgi:tetratricopeptide (TPR) repeat protein
VTRKRPEAIAVDLPLPGRYLCRMRPGLRPLLVLLLTVVFFTAEPGGAQESGDPAVRPAEYMIYQYPGTAMVVRVEAPGIPFDVRVSGPENAMLLESTMAGRRIGPLIQFIEAPDAPRQLMVVVNPAHRIDRNVIRMELMQFDAVSRNNRGLVQAYRLLSQGMAQVYQGERTSWAARAQSLRNAARIFAELGDEEMRLWSEVFAAHLVLHRVEDVEYALEFARGIQSAARHAGYERIELAALILEGDALMAFGGGSPDYTNVHTVLQRVAAAAGPLGYPGERGRALFKDGLVYEQQDRLDEAIERYQQALEVTAVAADPDLLNTIRSTAAEAYESRGSTAGAIGMLDEIATDLAAADSPDAYLERVRNLLEKARLLNRSYRFAEAVPVLREALGLLSSAGADGEAEATAGGIALGWSLYSLGQFDQASEVFDRALVAAGDSAAEQPLAAGWGALADIHRQRRDFDAMQGARNRQCTLSNPGSTRADCLLTAAVENWSRGVAHRQEAAAYLDRARREARSAGDALLSSRAVLLGCLFAAAGGGSCSDRQADAAFDTLIDSGIPAVSIEARRVRSVTRRFQGRSDAALSELERLVGDIRFYRTVLPGVMGAWYWLNRDFIYQDYLDLTLEAGPGGRGSDGERLLLAMESLRRIDPATGSGPVREPLRHRIAALESASGPRDPQEATAVNQRLDELRRDGGLARMPVNGRMLGNWLERLGEDESLLAFHFSSDHAYGVTASDGSVRLTRLAARERIEQAIDGVRTRLNDPGGAVPMAGLETLGSMLIGPLKRGLGRRVYLMTAGPLAGFPVDSLRMDGAFLAASRQLVNIGSLQALEGGWSRLESGFPEAVFVAGNPHEDRDIFSYGVSTSEEIAAVRDRFIGPGLHIVQGVALHRDEFSDERFRTAALLHLAMPGRVDLAFPDRSRLLLSGAREDPTAEFLMAGDIRQFRLDAGLAVLSGTAFSGQGTSHNGRIGLVSDLHAAGVRAVIATLWPDSDGATAQFMDDFYRRLDGGADVAGALFETRAGLMTTPGSTNFRTWARFQLHIR